MEAYEARHPDVLPYLRGASIDVLGWGTCSILNTQRLVRCFYVSPPFSLNRRDRRQM